MSNVFLLDHEYLLQELCCCFQMCGRSGRIRVNGESLAQKKKRKEKKEKRIIEISLFFKMQRRELKDSPTEAETRRKAWRVSGILQSSDTAILRRNPKQGDLEMNYKRIAIITTAIVVIIGIIALVTYELTVGFKKIYMSLEPNAFDDQYMGCEMDMMEKAEELLAEERKVDTHLNNVWEKAEERWKTLSLNRTERSIKKPFEIAVIAYTDFKIPFYRKFNDKVRTCCSSTEDYMKSFHFKAFHFYLTRAIQLLGGKCIPVYRGITRKIYPDRTREMRFGQFASSSKNIKVARDYAKGSGTLYIFTACTGASIQHLSYNKSEEEVLIPPYQVFRVSAFESNVSGLSTVHLDNKATCSNYNCAYMGGEKKDNCTSNSAPGNILAWPGHLTPLPLFGLLILLLPAWLCL
ncbi:ecto-ADP-ribosyltransferase 5-like isoform X2 [Petaurus breviceps papuanus]|uniref:ecto-ADP-ribosyltransferase 5-like isoform X2 n=1 Tax=Petaurus breviceps papuanus TaxID=3040969 RepID=UPI0036D8A9D3